MVCIGYRMVPAENVYTCSITYSFGLGNYNILLVNPLRTLLCIDSSAISWRSVIVFDVY